MPNLPVLHDLMPSLEAALSGLPMLILHASGTVPARRCVAEATDSSSGPTELLSGSAEQPNASTARDTVPIHVHARFMMSLSLSDREGWTREPVATAGVLADPMIT